MNVEDIEEAKNQYTKINNSATGFLQNMAKNSKEHYENNGSMNMAFVQAARTVPEDIKKRIESINKIENKTTEDKQEINKQYSRLETWKRSRISDKSKMKTIVEAVSDDMINYELMDPEYKTLLGQLINKDGDASSKGIKLFNREQDDKLMVEYSTDRTQKERESNNNMELSSGAAREVMSFDELMGGVHYKKVEAENNIYSIITGQAEDAGEIDTNSGKFTTASWDGDIGSGKSKTKKALTSVIKGGDIIADLSTRDIFGKGSTYREDLSMLVNNMDLSRLGIVDKGKPGYEDDLAKDALLKEDITGRLINPKTPEDLKFAEENMIDYMLLIAGQAFNNKRNELTAGQETQIKSTTSGMTPQEIIKKFSK